ncbi:Uncharacterised protein [Acinetobacter baumannii]|nr:Uncharacterised protein [Acinetobacter baumannii]
MNKATSSEPISAAAPMVQKMACQLNHSSSAPPIIGASSGAMVITRMTNDIMRENSSLVNMSRIKALITTLAAAAARPCKKRSPIS